MPSGMGVHDQLKHFKGDGDPLAKVAYQIGTECRLICFDEFHVFDIADAMILGGLFDALFSRGIVFLMTFNYPLDKLYLNGLQRKIFLPRIKLIKEKLDILEVDSGVDYQLRTLEQIQEKCIEFCAMVGNEGDASTAIEVLGREIPVLRQGSGVIWFDSSHCLMAHRTFTEQLH